MLDASPATFVHLPLTSCQIFLSVLFDGRFESAQTEPSGATATWLERPESSVHARVPADRGATPLSILPSATHIARAGRSRVAGIGRAANEAGDIDLGKNEFIARAENGGLELRLQLRAAGRAGVPATMAMNAIVKTVGSARKKVS
jgi:hypothetical protein